MIGGYVGKPIGGIVATGSASLSVTAGSYTITGRPAVLRAAIALTVGGYTITGQSSVFSGKLPVTTGTYALTGRSAVLTPSATVATAAYLIAGQSALFATKEPVIAGTYSVTGNAAGLNASEPAAKGTYAIAGASIALRLTLPVAPGSYTIAGSAAQLSLTAHGSGNDKRKRRYAPAVEVRLHDRKITVTDPDGTKRKVGYARRFRPPPPLEPVPEWLLPRPAAGAVEQARLLLPQPMWTPPPARIDQELADEEDVLAMLAMQDNTADIALALTFVAAAEVA